MKYIASAVVMTLIFCCLTHSVGADDAVSAGAKIAQQGTPKGATACMSCHGADGAGLAAAGFPRLAGLDAGYLAKQIRDFQLGTRSNPIMLPIAKALNGEEIVAVSTYYSTLPLPDNTLPDKQGPATQASAAEGKNLAQWGDWRARALPACGQCHGLQGNGVGSHFPGIAGQQAGYIKAQLQAWKTGTRNNDALGLMKSVASKLTDAEIEAVSTYYAALPPGKPITPTSPAAVVAMISAASSKDVRTGDVPQRGEKIYNNKCAFSHGEQGQGAACPDGRILYPPLWSAEAYNWGAGMHNIDVAAAFIKHNMPFGLAGNLTDQEAWDVAAFMNSHERPQDPRFKGDLQDTMEKFHGSKYDYYGKRKSADGFLLGEWPAARK